MGSAYTWTKGAQRVDCSVPLCHTGRGRDVSDWNGFKVLGRMKGGKMLDQTRAFRDVSDALLLSSIPLFPICRVVLWPHSPATWSPQRTQQPAMVNSTNTSPLIGR